MVEKTNSSDKNQNTKCCWLGRRRRLVQPLETATKETTKKQSRLHSLSRKTMLLSRSKSKQKFRATLQKMQN